MRIFSNPFEAIKEVERDLWEMGITVHTQTMQDKVIKNNPEYTTKEVRGYAFKITGWQYNYEDLLEVIKYFFPDNYLNVMEYCMIESTDRLSGKALNPGNSYLSRLEVWKEFLHDYKFAYTYSERIAPQLTIILEELKKNPETRQGIINIHSNICPLDCWPEHTEVNVVNISKDLDNRGGGGRVPCSMYYQLMIREDKIDLIYTMRSCDLLTHFPVDLILALMIQNWFAVKLNKPIGTFTYFTGSLHAYFIDMEKRGIF